MNNKKTFYEKFQFFLEKSKIPFAYILFTCIAIVEYIPIDIFPNKNIILFSAVFTLGLIILKIVFDIYKKINEPKKTLPFFQTWNDLTDSGELRTVLEKRILDDNKVNIKVIGISLRFHWRYLQNLMLKYINDNKNVTFEVELAILNHEFYDKLAFIDEDFKQKFYQNALATESGVNHFRNQYSLDELNCKCNINLYKYNFMPSVYGILIDNKFLFLGNTYWKNGILHSAGQSYNLFVEDDEFSGSEKINIFNSWFNYIIENEKVTVNTIDQ